MDFKSFLNPNKQQSQPSQLTPLQARLMETVDKYKSEVPVTLQVMLSSLLPTLGSKMTDEKILFFVEHTRNLLDYIERGEELPFTDIEGDEDHVGH